jgi:hypothetical protein
MLEAALSAARLRFLPPALASWSEKGIRLAQKSKVAHAFLRRCGNAAING